MSRADALGREVAALFERHATRLFADLMESRVAAWPADRDARARARLEWECFALYACVRGIVAGADFGGETARAIDAFHAAAVPGRMASAADFAADELRRRVSERYDAYAEIGKAGGASGAASVATRLGASAARHMLGSEPTAEVAELVGELHEHLVEAVADAVRGAGGEPPSEDR